MGRREEAIKALQHGAQLSLSESFYKEWLDRFVVERIKFEREVVDGGDITTQLASPGENRCLGAVISKSEGVSAGIEEVSYIFERFGTKVLERVSDGVEIHPGTTLMLVEGNASTSLFLERMVLDILQRMCGIATLTASVLKRVGKDVLVAATRKTPLGYLDKKAVFCGGGLTHRLGLWDGILVKDNHLSLLGNEHLELCIQDILRRLISQIDMVKRAHFVEIEADSGEQALSVALELDKVKEKLPFPSLVLLDNIPPNSIKDIVMLLREKGLYNRLLLEASGGITEKNISEFAGCGVDVVSLGELTHSPKALDICFEVKELSR